MIYFIQIKKGDIQMKIAIDKMIDERRCPERSLCIVATTGMTEQQREHKCYLCWREYCNINNIEIDYEYIEEKLLTNKKKSV